MHSLKFHFFKKATNLNERKFVISIEPDTRSISGLGALLRYSLYLVNLLGIVVRCPRVHLPVVEKVVCDIEI